MTLNDIEKSIQSEKIKVKKAMAHLLYSFSKLEKLNFKIDLEDLEVLEIWESFTSRFSRLSHIISKKLIRSLVLKGDPSFRESLVDFLNMAEKFHYISDTNRWWAIRALPNKEAH